MIENEEGHYIVGDRNILNFSKDYFKKVHPSKNIPVESIAAFTDGMDIPVSIPSVKATILRPYP